MSLNLIKNQVITKKNIMVPCVNCSVHIQSMYCLHTQRHKYILYILCIHNYMYLNEKQFVYNYKHMTECPINLHYNKIMIFMQCL